MLEHRSDNEEVPRKSYKNLACMIIRRNLAIPPDGNHEVLIWPIISDLHSQMINFIRNTHKIWMMKLVYYFLCD